MVLKKSRNNRMIAGVCGGLATAIGIPALWVRLIFVFGSGAFFWIYLYLAYKLPEEDYLA